MMASSRKKIKRWQAVWSFSKEKYGPKINSLTRLLLALSTPAASLSLKLSRPNSRSVACSCGINSLRPKMKLKDSLRLSKLSKWKSKVTANLWEMRSLDFKNTTKSCRGHRGRTRLNGTLPSGEQLSLRPSTTNSRRRRRNGGQITMKKPLKSLRWLCSLPKPVRN